MLKKLTYLSLFLLLVGCSSSPYTYYNKSIPIQKGITKYNLKEVTVNLSLGHGAIENDTSFASQEELKKQFTDALEKYLKEKSIFDAGISANSIGVSVNIDYLRTFNWGGKALNKPEISHAVFVSKGNTKLASFGRSRYTTKYAYFKNVAVGFKIASFKWGADDELKDVDLISKLIIDDLSELGK